MCLIAGTGPGLLIGYRIIPNNKDGIRSGDAVAG